MEELNNVIELKNKAIVNFRNNYKIMKKSLTLEDFIIYSIIRGKNPENTIIDSNYEVDVSPIGKHLRYTADYMLLHTIDTVVYDYLNNRHNNYYYLKYYRSTDYKDTKINRINVLFGLNIEEFLILFNNFITKNY